MVLFIIVGIPLTWFGYEYRAGDGAIPTLFSMLFFFGLAAVFTLFADEAKSYPDRLAKSFTRVVRVSSGLRIESTWVCALVVIAPVLPVVIFSVYVGFFDHSFFSDNAEDDWKYTVIGYIAASGLVFLLLAIGTGFRCEISKGHVSWAWSYLGRYFRSKEFNNVHMVEYSQSGEVGYGGPTPTIAFDGKNGKRSIARLRFRKLYRCSREEFGDLLAEFLGEPECRTLVPTITVHEPRWGKRTL